MNQFKSKLAKAQARQRNIYAIIISVFVLGAISLFALFAYSSGTVVEVKPKDAGEIARIDVVEGPGMVVSNVIYALSNEPRISVSAKGFKGVTKTLSAQEKGHHVTITLSELPGQLIAKTSPDTETTRWTINGHRVAIAARMDRALAPGTYRLEVDNPFYEIEKRVVKMARAAVQDLTIPLRPLNGAINIESLPSGATVLLNGQDIGTTPLSHKIEGGKAHLEVRKQGFQAISEEISVTNTNRTIVRHYQLVRQSATLAFKLAPPRGTLLVNGKKSNPKKSVSVGANINNTVTYAKQGYVQETQTVKVSAGHTQTLNFKLEPEMGTVDIKSTPGALVFVDGRAAGKTPIVLTLQAINHAIRLSRPGYRSIEKTIVPTSKQTTVVHEKLRPEQTARLSESPLFYKNSIGMALMRFQPTGFVMGAPRSQKGQRANEFVRKIKLNKPFYAGQYEVTVGQYKKFKEAYAGTGEAQFPVTSISWLDAAHFCNWLSAKESLSAVYDISNGRLKGVNGTANGYRLLTEAEWEWLARRASRPAQTVFTWGNTATVPPMAGNIADLTARGMVQFYVPNYTDGFAELAPVGSFAKETSGLFDLTGNASEWVHDYYSVQPPAKNVEEVNPMGPRYGDAHVVKGASWRSGTRTTLRPAYRDGLIDRRDDVGFRIARYL